MSKLLTPQEVLQALLDGEKVEIKGAIAPQNSVWEPLNEHEIHIRVLTNGLFIFRLAQEMITVSDVSFPKPMSEPLETGTEYWVTNPTRSHLLVLDLHRWCGDAYDLRHLHRGLIHLSRENAIAHAKALIKLSGGNVDD